MTILPQVSSAFNHSHSNSILVEVISLRCVDQPFVRAVASIRVHDDLLIHGVRVVHQAGRLRVLLPQRRTQDGEWVPTVEAAPALQALISDAVIEAWRSAAACSWR